MRHLIVVAPAKPDRQAVLAAEFLDCTTPGEATPNRLVVTSVVEAAATRKTLWEVLRATRSSPTAVAILADAVRPSDGADAVVAGWDGESLLDPGIGYLLTGRVLILVGAGTIDALRAVASPHGSSASGPRAALLFETGIQPDDLPHFGQELFAYIDLWLGVGTLQLDKLRAVARQKATDAELSAEGRQALSKLSINVFEERPFTSRDHFGQ